jgi:hypothetical protein
VKKHPLNIYIYIFIFTYFIISSKIEAKILYWPDFCSNGTLHVTNTGSNEKFVWLQKFDDQLQSETELAVSAQSTLNFHVEKTHDTERNSLLYFDNTSELKARFTCLNEGHTTSLFDGGLLTYKRSSSNHHKLWLQNIYSDMNDVKVKILDKKTQLIKEMSFSLNKSETKAISLDTFSNWQNIQISSLHKFSSFLLNGNGSEKPSNSEPIKTEIDSKASYFLVGSRSGEDDTFVVKISDEKLIAQARQLIKNPSSEKIVFAQIKKDHQGFNRNFNNPSKSLWSWSTSEVTSFGDFGSTSCNGHPQTIEDRVDSWVEYPGRICFWDYRLKKELTIEEVQTGKLKP